jgi:hypothetical protein
MDLALCGPRTDRAPAHQIGVELSERRIQKLRSGRQAQLGNIREKPTRHPEALVDVIRAVEVRIVDQAFPSQRRARLLEVDAHHHEDALGDLVRQLSKSGRKLDCRVGVVNRARSDHGE